MALRFDDSARELSCAVRDLVEHGRTSPHLSVRLARSRGAHLASGRAIHAEHQRAMASRDPDFQAEHPVRLRVQVEGWTAHIFGRIDGMSVEAGRSVVEEVKAVALDRSRLWETTIHDWAEHTTQLAIYCWMLAQQGEAAPRGRLVLVSSLDGSRHVLGLPDEHARVGERVRATLGRWVRERAARIAWMAARRGHPIPWPHDLERPGQRAILDQVTASLSAGRTLLVEAPTGLGKTAAVLVGALRAAMHSDRQVCWVTARTTQQRVVVETARALIRAGLPLRVVVITAREKACLNDVVDCRPEVCPFAERYHDKVDEADSVQALLGGGPASALVVRDHGEAIVACPYQLASDAARSADLVVADYNYVFDPDVAGANLYGEDPERWFVVVDEAHQLVERGRGYGSPRVDRAIAERAIRDLQAAGPAFEGVLRLAEHIRDQLDLAAGSRPEERTAELDVAAWRDLAERIDAIAVDYALLRLDRAPRSMVEDPWLDLARSTLRLAEGTGRLGPDVVALVSGEGVRLLCLDPSALLGPSIARLGGLIGCSATLHPADFYRDLLGLDAARLDRLDVPSPFPIENRRVVIAPRVSTRFVDRAAHADRTAALISSVVQATPGTAAVYFPSFAMLEDLAARLELAGRPALVQRRSLDEAARRQILDALIAPGPPRVLLAVLGGIFAEGVDLPGGALRTVVVVGPGLPPVGLERDLLRAAYEARYGAGFAYASLIPGMTRVIQAAGRLIRGPSDRGCVVLVGQRFRWRAYAAMLPASWAPDVPEDPRLAVDAFFASLTAADAVGDAAT